MAEEIKLIAHLPSVQAAAFAVGQNNGPAGLASGVTPMHLLTAGGYLVSQGFNGVELVAQLALAFEVLTQAAGEIQ